MALKWTCELRNNLVGQLTSGDDDNNCGIGDNNKDGNDDKGADGDDADDNDVAGDDDDDNGVMMLPCSSGWAAGGSRVMDWRETRWQHIAPSTLLHTFAWFCTLFHTFVQFCCTFVYTFADFCVFLHIGGNTLLKSIGTSMQYICIQCIYIIHTVSYTHLTLPTKRIV